MRAGAGRIGALAVAGLVLGAVALGYFGSGEDPAPRERPGSSSEDGGSHGIYGWRVLLQSSGRAVDTEEQVPARAALDPEATAVLIDPGSVAAEDAAALRSFVSAGGRLVVGGDVDARLLAVLADPGADRSSGASAQSLRGYAPAPELAGVTTIEAAGEGSFERVGGALPIAGAERPALLRAAVGDGVTLALADASPLQNRMLARADNAQLALGLVGEEGRPVVFIERVRAPASTGVAALPGSWGWTAGGLVLAALILAAARARRLGPPQLRSRPLPPPRRAYLDALAGLLARSRDRSATTARLRAHARLLLARRAGISEDEGEEKLRRAGLAAGLGEGELDAVLSGDTSATAMLACASGLARLRKTSRWRSG